MITTNVRLHFMIYSLMWLFSLQTIVAPSVTGLLDVVHNSFSGTSGTHDTGAVKSTIEASGEKLSHPQPCHRSMESCILGPAHHVSSTRTTTRSNASKNAKKSGVTQTLAPPKSLKTSVILTLHRLERINLGKLSFSNPSGKLYNGALASTLADISTARQRSTTILELNPEVRRYISQTRLLELYQKLGNTLRKELEHLTEKGKLIRDGESKTAMLHKLFKPPEVPNPEKTWARINWEDFVDFPLVSYFMACVDKLQRTEPDLFFGQLYSPDQFEEEEDHLNYVRGINKPVLEGWTSNIEQLTKDLKESTVQSAWIGPKVNPEKFRVSDYRILEKINPHRQSLIEKATQVAARSLDSSELEHQEMNTLPTLALKTLMLEGRAETFR
ncbi:hypothetical protein DFH28DRAFT_1077970 [Melampsora americana]|nr:hypothetical protein DFH28DRAFT_1077970 [Melampsora americana]